MKAMMAYLTSALLILTSSLAVAQPDTRAISSSLNWKLKRDKDGVRVYTAPVPDSKHAAVRGTMEVATPIKELVALILDTDACSEWAALCKESFVADRRSATDFDVYTYNDIPWPVKDRDAVTRVTWSVNPDTGGVHMVAEIIGGIVEKNKKAIRLTTGVTSWTFTPTEAGTRVENYAHIDPEGSTPAWLTNMLLVDAPHDTLVAMRKAVADGAYADAKVSFLESTEMR